MRAIWALCAAAACIAAMAATQVAEFPTVIVVVSVLTMVVSWL
jgi:hypothetical protein